MKELSAVLRQLVGSDQAGRTLATLVNVTGSSYRRAGARLLIGTDGARTGTISGGCLEEDVLARARRVAATGTAEVVVYDTTSENDLVWGVGLGCHGVVTVLIERLPVHVEWADRLAEKLLARTPGTLVVRYRGPDPAHWGTGFTEGNHPSDGCLVQVVTPPTKLVLFGGGDDAQPLVRLAAELGWLVTVCDPRPGYADSKRFPPGTTVLTGAPDLLVPQAGLDEYSVAVVMTHHYVHDVPLLRALLPSAVPYVGLLGPRKRAEKILGDLAADGLAVSAAQRSRFHAPVGLDLGADSPEQVALAIVAEIQAFLNGRSAQSLRERERPIHS